jgi:hypothetical protein
VDALPAGQPSVVKASMSSTTPIVAKQDNGYDMQVDLRTLPVVAVAVNADGIKSEYAGTGGFGFVPANAMPTVRIGDYVVSEGKAGYVIAKNKAGNGVAIVTDKDEIVIVTKVDSVQQKALPVGRNMNIVRGSVHIKGEAVDINFPKSFHAQYPIAYKGASKVVESSALKKGALIPCAFCGVIHEKRRSDSITCSEQCKIAFNNQS